MFIIIKNPIHFWSYGNIYKEQRYNLVDTKNKLITLPGGWEKWLTRIFKIFTHIALTNKYNIKSTCDRSVLKSGQKYSSRRSYRPLARRSPGPPEASTLKTPACQTRDGRTPVISNSMHPLSPSPEKNCTSSEGFNATLPRTPVPFVQLTSLRGFTIPGIFIPRTGKGHRKAARRNGTESPFRVSYRRRLTRLVCFSCSVDREQRPGPALSVRFG